VQAGERCRIPGTFVKNLQSRDCRVDATYLATSVDDNSAPDL
jgi:hypothetical protein